MRNIISVIVGYAVWTALWLGGTLGLQAAMPEALPHEGVVDSASALALVLVVSVMCSVCAGSSTRKLSAARGHAPVVVMALFLLATGIAIQASSWERMPVWYHLTFLVLLLPVSVLGGRLVAK